VLNDEQRELVRSLLRSVVAKIAIVPPWPSRTPPGWTRDTSDRGDAQPL